MKDKQLRAIELLALGEMTVKAIAEELEVSRTTIYAWLKNSEFKAKLKEMNDLKDAYLKQELKEKAKDYLKEMENVANKSKNQLAKIRALENLLNYAGWQFNESQEITFKSDDDNSNKLLQMWKSKNQEQVEQSEEQPEEDTQEGK